MEFAPELARETALRFVPLAKPGDPVPSAMKTLLRKPFAAQQLVINGLVKHFHRDDYCNLIGEMGTGKTLISISTIHCHADGKPYTALVQAPPQLTHKWAREILATIPRARVFFVEGIRNNPSKSTPAGVNEVGLDAKGRIRYSGQRLKMSDLKLMGRREWLWRYPIPTFFVMGKDRAKLSYALRPVLQRRSIFVRNEGGATRPWRVERMFVNPDTGRPVVITEKDVEINANETHLGNCKRYLSEVVTTQGSNPASMGTKRFSPLWQADRTKDLRMAPTEYIGRYLRKWFTYAIADEMHQLAGETAQGQSFSWVLAAARYGIGMTGTKMGGYADDEFNLIYRSNPCVLIKDGYEWGEEGKTAFQRTYGIIETIHRTDESVQANTYSRVKKKSTTRIKKKPGCSPLVFAKYFLENTAFVSLEEMSCDLPPYTEEVVEVTMDRDHQNAYTSLVAQFAEALRECPGPAQAQLRSRIMHTLLLYPDHPFDLKPVTYTAFDEDGDLCEYLAGTPANFGKARTLAKEMELVATIRAELNKGRRCQIYVQYTQEHDVRTRLAQVLEKNGIRTAVLTSSVKTEKREEWYAEQVVRGVEVVICHPRLVETGLDLYAFPTLIFHQTPYSLHTLRQASRRSWRIGQTSPVRVLFDVAAKTTQASCVRLMGKKMLCALAMEGKFMGSGLTTLDEDGDLFSNLARELLQQDGVRESASAVWGDVAKQRNRIMATSETGVSEGKSEETFEDEVPITVVECAKIIPFAPRPTLRGTQLSLFELEATA